MAIPAWRERQLDDAAAERERRAQERLGTICALDEDPDAPLVLVCQQCFRRCDREHLKADARGRLLCPGCR